LWRLLGESQSAGNHQAGQTSKIEFPGHDNGPDLLKGGEQFGINDRHDIVQMLDRVEISQPGYAG
jgi:hypothetical protein